MRANDLALLILGATLRGDEYFARCPAHDDHNPSLTFKDGERGVLIRCHAGCQPEAIVRACGLTLRDLFFDSSTHTNGQSRNGRIVATYSYRDEQDEPLFEV